MVGARVTVAILVMVGATVGTKSMGVKEGGGAAVVGTAVTPATTVNVLCGKTIVGSIIACTGIVTEGNTGVRVGEEGGIVYVAVGGSAVGMGCDKVAVTTRAVAHAIGEPNVGLCDS